MWAQSRQGERGNDVSEREKIINHQFGKKEGAQKQTTHGEDK